MPPITEREPQLTGEALKTKLIPVSEARSQDALHGVKQSPLGIAAHEVTVGPYNGELKSSRVAQFLSDPNQVIIVACGRNEAARGNLEANLAYIQRSTAESGNVIYVDANSTDHSAELAQSLGVDTYVRKDVLSQFVDLKALARVLAVPVEALEGEDVPGQPPLRKGIDVLVARVILWQLKQQEIAPKNVIYTDTDLKSIPGGSLEQQLIGQAEVENQLAQQKGETLPDDHIDRKVYRPLQLAVMGVFDLASKRQDENTPVVFTGSENRNNETIFALANIVRVHANSPFIGERGKQIAHALAITLDPIVHPLTGELIISTESELDVMGATGQCVEIARHISLAQQQHNKLGNLSPKNLQEMLPLVGNARRGPQQRMDESQSHEKEWWMIVGVIPMFWEVVTHYMMQKGKYPQEFTQEDYIALNTWLSDNNTASRLNNDSQTKEVDEFPMERAIPSVQQLHDWGILKI